jgi:hypothetical protein
MLRSCLATSVLGLLTASAAHAEMSYSYVDGTLAVTAEDTATLGEQDGMAAELEFSYDILRYLHVFASYERSELDDLAVDGDVLQAGAGVHFDPGENKSVFFNLAALTAEFDVATTLGTVSADDDGYSYALGYREVTKTGRTEFLISAEHQELSDADTGDTWINMNFVFRVTPRLRILGGVTFAGEENAARVGVRYYLPNRFQRD